MKIFTIDVKWQDYKPSNVLDWLGIDYTSIKSLKSIPNRPNDICLASQKQFAQHLTDNLSIVLPTKKSPRTGELIPAFSKTDAAYVQMCNMYPQYKHIY